MEKIGLITITYNSADVISGFLDSTLKQSYKNFEIFIIDNDSQDDTEKVIFQYDDPRINFIKNSENLGVAKANNKGIKIALQANCSQVLIINNDTEFEDKLLEKMLSIQKRKNCSLVAPKIMYFDKPDHIWYAGSFFVKKKGYLPIHIGIQHKDLGQYDGVYPVEYAPTCCLLVRKKVFEDVGMMDEKYFVYFDDTDFLYRVFKDDRHRLYFFSDIKFYHKVGSLTKSVENKQRKEFRGDFFIKQNTRNHVYFLKKIGGVFAYMFIAFLFIKNNIRIFTNPKIKCNYRTWKLINQSFFEGIKM